MDYIAFCERFYVATGIPVILLKGGSPVYSSMNKLSSASAEAKWDMWPNSRNPEIITQTANLEYGRVRIEGTDYDIIIGPLFATPVTEEIVAEFLSDAQTPREDREEAAELLYSLPLLSHHHCLRYLIFLHLCLNHQLAEIEDFYAEQDTREEARQEKHVREVISFKDEENFRNSYAFELRMYHYIEAGELGKLKRFWETTKEFPLEGRLARSPLRHAKNRFITVAAKAVVLGAIPGGLEAEKAYQLQDLYCMECEQMQTIEEVRRLEYIMLTDLCQRTGSAKIPKGISAEIYRCVSYIKNHTNTSVTIDDIADYMKRSRSYLIRHFKEEMGVNLNDFIIQCKMKDACDMLCYTDKPLAEISNYLSFSSQSYFQNVFKKIYGITPLQYRKQNQKTM